MNVKRALAGLVSFSTGSVSSPSLRTTALADMKNEVGGGMIILSSTLAKVHCRVSGTSACVFQGTYNGSWCKAPGK